MKITLAIVALLLGAGVFAYSQAKREGTAQSVQRETEQALQKLEQQWAEAVKRRDVETISRIQSDDFEFTGPSGEIWTKARALEFIKAGNLEIHSFEISEFKARVFGDTAIVNFRVMWNAAANGNDISGPQRMTDVFVKREGRWQCVASQTTPIQGS
jgi:ketosteroid isomerase-like protein